MRLDHLLSKETSKMAKRILVTSSGQYKGKKKFVEALFNLEGTVFDVPRKVRIPGMGG